MILPKHAFEAMVRLNSIEADIAPYKEKSIQYFSNEKTYTISKSIGLMEYLKNLLIAVANLDSKISDNEKAAIQFLFGESTSLCVISEQNLYLKPPSLIYDAFMCQVETKDVILPDVLSNIKTLISYIGQFECQEESDKLYNRLLEIYQEALEKKNTIE